MSDRTETKTEPPPACYKSWLEFYRFFETMPGFYWLNGDHKPALPPEHYDNSEVVRRAAVRGSSRSRICLGTKGLMET